MTQADRALDWTRADTATVLRHLRAADGFPGVRDELLGLPVLLFDAHADATARGAPGRVIGHHDGAILRATIDGAVWIGHLGGGRRRCVQAARRAGAGRPPRRRAGGAAVAGPRRRVAADPLGEHGTSACCISRSTTGPSTPRSARRCAGVLAATARPVRVLVLAGGPDFWSNGIHLNAIEAAAEPADESWRNINAMNDLVHAIVTADRQLTVAAMQGNGGAGGVFLALAADRVWARDGVVLNPHYKGMGNLYGSDTGRTCCRGA